MRKTALVVALVVATGGMTVTTGCARRSAAPAGEPAAESGKREIAAPPADSPLAKIQPGMTGREVEDILGRPDDENEYITGKAFIPWYFGRDRSRRAFFYKGLGRVVLQGAGGFSRNYTVRHVEYDPSETGRAR